MLGTARFLKRAVVVGLIAALAPTVANLWAHPVQGERVTPQRSTIVPGAANAARDIPSVRGDVEARRGGVQTAQAGGFLLNNGSDPVDFDILVSGIDNGGGWSVFQPFTVVCRDGMCR